MPKKPSYQHRLSVLRRLTPHSTQKAFAQFIGVPESTLQKIELGKRALSEDLAEQVKFLTGISVDWLLSKSDHCLCCWAPMAYDSGACFFEDDLLDVEKLVRRLVRLSDVASRYVAGLLLEKEATAMRAWVEELDASPTFSEAWILSLPDFAPVIARPPVGDALSSKIKGYLPKSTLQLLGEDLDKQRVSGLRAALAHDIDLLVRSKVRLYGPDAAPVESLPPALRIKISQNPKGDDLARVNLRILCLRYSGIVCPHSLECGSAAQEMAGYFNRIISEKLIYAKDDVGRIPLRPETKQALGLKPTGEELKRLNRLILEDALPDHIQRDHGRGFREWDKLNPDRRQFPPEVVSDAPTLIYSINVLLRAGAENGKGTDRAVLSRLLRELHDTAVQFGLVDQIFRILSKDSAKPEHSLPLDARILDSNPSWEWLFYGPGGSAEGGLSAEGAARKQIYDETLRRCFPCWKWGSGAVPK